MSAATRRDLQAPARPEPTSPTPWVWGLLAGILILAAVTRVLLAAGATRGELTNQDSASYLGSAAALEVDGRFNVGPASDIPMFFRTPGYPLFLAALRVVLGDSINTLAVGQAVLSTLIVLGVFVLARRLFGGWRIPLVAAAAAAFEPLQVWSATQIGTEALASAAYVVIALAATWASKRASPWPWAVVGLAIAAATYVRPGTYYFPVLLAVVLVLGMRFVDGWPGWRRAALCAVALVVPCVLCLGAWQVRNHRTVDSWRFSSVEAINMYEYRAAGVIAKESGRPFGVVRREFQARFLAEHPHPQQGPYIDAMFDEGRDIVVRHPRALVEITVAGAASLLGGVRHGLLPMLGVESSSATDAIARLGLAAFYAFTAFGVIVVLGRLRRDPVALAHIVILFLVGYVLLVSSGPESSPRLRAPVTPLLGLYFAFGVVTAIQRLQSRSHRDVLATEQS